MNADATERTDDNKVVLLVLATEAYLALDVLLVKRPTPAFGAFASVVVLLA